MMIEINGISREIGPGVDLCGADLHDADLEGADLRGADLRGADLRDADLRGADLGDADLRRANLSGADLRRADLSRADLRGAIHSYAVPVIPDLDRQIWKILQQSEGRLDMNQWHTCNTTHCRAGWAIHIAGCYDLERRIGPSAAGALIYAAARPDRRIPNFYGAKEAVLAELMAGGNDE